MHHSSNPFLLGVLENTHESQLGRVCIDKREIWLIINLILSTIDWIIHLDIHTSITQSINPLTCLRVH